MSNLVRSIAIFVTMVIVLFSQFGYVQGEDKLDLLLSKRGSNLIATLNKKEFEYFALKEPRPYNLVIFFTMSGRGCDQCEVLENELPTVSYSYNYAGKDQKQGSELPSVFVQLEFTQDRRDIFEGLGVDRVPVIGVSRPSHL